MVYIYISLNGRLHEKPSQMSFILLEYSKITLLAKGRLQMSYPFFSGKAKSRFSAGFLFIAESGMARGRH